MEHLFFTSIHTWVITIYCPDKALSPRRVSALDLASYFKITDINQAITETIDDSEILEGVIMDISPDANLEELFRPLSNNSSVVDFLDKMKAKGSRTNRHASWLRIYAIRLSEGIYIITGGTI